MAVVRWRDGGFVREEGTATSPGITEGRNPVLSRPKPIVSKGPLLAWLCHVVASDGVGVMGKLPPAAVIPVSATRKLPLLSWACLARHLDRLWSGGTGGVCVRLSVCVSVRASAGVRVCA